MTCQSKIIINHIAKKISITFGKIQSLFEVINIFTISFIITVAQLIDTYMRWLAFSAKTLINKRQLAILLVIWGVASFFLYDFIFNVIGITAATFKAILMLGWIPYFLICLVYIPIGLTQHIFVLGMAAICSLTQHTIAAIIVIANFSDKSDAEIILFDITCYLLLFLIFFPLLRGYFIKLLPGQEVFNLRPYGIYIAIFPLIIVSGHLLRIADNILIHSLAERLSRIYLPIVFFFFYRYILTAAKNYYELQRMERNKSNLEDQVTKLKKYNDHIYENQKKISVMRHDLRHNYNLIYAMLESGDIKAALEHINKQKEDLK